jgi:predicted ABC-type transport system involved in lysophospholipase L1 biosynthesis ATPase subunit
MLQHGAAKLRGKTMGVVFQSFELTHIEGQNVLPSTSRRYSLREQCQRCNAGTSGHR